MQQAEQSAGQGTVEMSASNISAARIQAKQAETRPHCGKNCGQCPGRGRCGRSEQKQNL